MLNAHVMPALTRRYKGEKILLYPNKNLILETSLDLKAKAVSFCCSLEVSVVLEKEV